MKGLGGQKKTPSLFSSYFVDSPLNYSCLELGSWAKDISEKNRYKTAIESVK